MTLEEVCDAVFALFGSLISLSCRSEGPGYAGLSLHDAVADLQANMLTSLAGCPMSWQMAARQLVLEPRTKELAAMMDDAMTGLQDLELADDVTPFALLDAAAEILRAR